MAEPCDVYDFITRLGSATKLPGDWNKYKCESCFFDMKLAPAELWQQLKNTFEVDDLVRAGAATLSSGKEVALSPLLAKPGTFIAVRKSHDPKPVDLLGRTSGSLSRRWALSAALDDDGMQKGLERLQQQLLVVPSVGDAAVLRSFGFPAVITAGLRRLTGKGAELLGKQLGLRTREATPGDAGDAPGQHESAESSLFDRSIALVLTNWSAAELDLSDVPSILGIRDDLQQIDKNFGLELGDFTVWKPTPADLERLRFCIERGTPQFIYNALHDSLTESCEPLELPGRRSPIPQNYAGAVTAWAAYPDDPLMAHLKSRAWERVQQFLREELIDPLRQRARETNDPLKRNCIETAANLSAMVHPLTLRLATGIAKPAANGVAVPRGFPREDFQQAMALIDRTFALTKDVLSCGPNRRIKPASPAKPKPKKTEPSSPTLDSAPRNAPR
jgi:hypothetical protein